MNVIYNQTRFNGNIYSKYIKVMLDAKNENSSPI